MKLYLKRILFAVISVQMAMVASFELFAQNVTGTVKDAATNEGSSANPCVMICD